MLRLLFWWLRRLGSPLEIAFIATMGFALATMTGWPSGLGLYSRIVIYAFAFALCMAGVTRIVQEKLFFVLPLSKRQRGRTAWTAAVVGPSVFMAASGMIAAGVAAWTGAAYGASTMLVLAIGLFSYAGATTLLLSAAPARAGRLADTSATIVWVVALVASPVVAAATLPAATTDLLSWRGAVLVVALVLAGISWFRAERLAVRGTSAHNPAPERRPADLPGANLATWPSRATGRFGPFRARLRADASIAAIDVIVTLIAAMLFDGYLNDWPRALIDELRYVVSQAPWRPTAELPVTFLLLFPLIFSGEMTSSTFIANFRLLRTQPVSARELCLILLARTLVSWLTVLLILAVVSLAVQGDLPGWFRAGPLIAIAGAGVLARALSLGRPRGETRFPRVVSLGAVAAILTPWERLFATSLPVSAPLVAWLPIVTGATTMLLAFVLTRRALDRSMTLYRPWKAPFVTGA